MGAASAQQVRAAALQVKGAAPRQPNKQAHLGMHSLHPRFRGRGCRKAGRGQAQPTCANAVVVCSSLRLASARRMGRLRIDTYPTCVGNGHGSSLLVDRRVGRHKSRLRMHPRLSTTPPEWQEGVVSNPRGNRTMLGSGSRHGQGSHGAQTEQGNKSSPWRPGTWPAGPRPWWAALPSAAHQTRPRLRESEAGRPGAGSVRGGAG